MIGSARCSPVPYLSAEDITRALQQAAHSGIGGVSIRPDVEQMFVEAQPLGLLQEQPGQSLSLERFVYGEPVYDCIRPVVEPPAFDRPVFGFLAEEDRAVSDRPVMPAQYVSVARFDVAPEVFVRRVSVLPLRIALPPHPFAGQTDDLLRLGAVAGPGFSEQYVCRRPGDRRDPESGGS